jgi:hypothetical protein
MKVPVRFNSLEGFDGNELASLLFCQPNIFDYNSQ